MFVIYWLGYITEDNHDIGCGNVGTVVNEGEAVLEALTMATGLSGVSEGLWIVPGTLED